MKQEEVESIAKQIIEERFKAASHSMQRMHQLKKLYASLRNMGHHEAANAMRDTVFWFLAEKPDATELEVVLMLAETCGIDVDSKKQK